MGAKIIQVEKATKAFQTGDNTIRVFEDLDFAVDAGKFIALMGPSGSGKSTLLHTIGGIERLTRGRVTVADRVISDASESQLCSWRAASLGFVFQFYNLMPMLDARSNIELPLLLSSGGATKRSQRIQTVADLVGISHRLGHRPREMSGGEQQRVAIARAIVSDPPILLCDEPTGDLDGDTSIEVLEILRMLSQDLGKTIVMVTHDPIAAGYADRVFNFNKGQIEEAQLQGRLT
ncbi:MAG: ABC transporter ATP-binding protein [Pseudomonadota bacterium]